VCRYVQADSLILFVVCGVSSVERCWILGRNQPSKSCQHQ